MSKPVDNKASVPSLEERLRFYSDPERLQSASLRDFGEAQRLRDELRQKHNASLARDYSSKLDVFLMGKKEIRDRANREREFLLAEQRDWIRKGKERGISPVQRKAFEFLGQRLSHVDERERRLVLSDLMPALEGFPANLEIFFSFPLDTATPASVSAGLSLLAQSPWDNQRHFTAVERSLNSEDLTLRLAAIEALGTLLPSSSHLARAVDLLSGMLRNSFLLLEERVRIARALWRLGPRDDPARFLAIYAGVLNAHSKDMLPTSTQAMRGIAEIARTAPPSDALNRCMEDLIGKMLGVWNLSVYSRPGERPQALNFTYECQVALHELYGRVGRTGYWISFWGNRLNGKEPKMREGPLARQIETLQELRHPYRSRRIGVPPAWVGILQGAMQRPGSVPIYAWPFQFIGHKDLRLRAIQFLADSGPPAMGALPEMIAYFPKADPDLQGNILEFLTNHSDALSDDSIFQAFIRKSIVPLLSRRTHHGLAGKALDFLKTRTEPEFLEVLFDFVGRAMDSQGTDAQSMEFASDWLGSLSPEVAVVLNRMGRLEELLSLASGHLNAYAAVSTPEVRQNIARFLIHRGEAVCVVAYLKQVLKDPLPNPEELRILYLLEEEALQLLLPLEEAFARMGDSEFLKGTGIKRRREALEASKLGVAAALARVAALQQKLRDAPPVPDPYPVIIGQSERWARTRFPKSARDGIRRVHSVLLPQPDSPPRARLTPQDVAAAAIALSQTLDHAAGFMPYQKTITQSTLGDAAQALLTGLLSVTPNQVLEESTLRLGVGARTAFPEPPPVENGGHKRTLWDYHRLQVQGMVRRLSAPEKQGPPPSNHRRKTKRRVIKAQKKSAGSLKSRMKAKAVPGRVFARSLRRRGK